MEAKEICNFADECVAELGELVGRMRKKGHELGFSKEETKLIWTTTFDILARKQGISEDDVRVAPMRGKKQKATPQEVA